MNFFYIIPLVFTSIAIGSILSFIIIGIVKKQEISNLHIRFSSILKKAVADIDNVRDKRLAATKQECEDIKLDLEKEMNVKVDYYCNGFFIVTLLLI